MGGPGAGRGCMGCPGMGRAGRGALPRACPPSAGAMPASIECGVGRGGGSSTVSCVPQVQVESGDQEGGNMI